MAAGLRFRQMQRYSTWMEMNGRTLQMPVRNTGDSMEKMAFGILSILKARLLRQHCVCWWAGMSRVRRESASVNGKFIARQSKKISPRHR